MQNKIYYFLIMLVGFALVISNGCKKDDEKDPSTVTDMDGNVYNTVKIATQTWMTENLKTTTYNDGSSIPLLADSALWGNSSSPAYCWYRNDEGTYKPKYGALYNWYAINTGKLCPKGWHIPSDAEWETLIKLSVRAGYLTESGTSHWTITSSGAEIEAAFTAHPAGFRYFDGGFSTEGTGGIWFSSSLDINGFPKGITLSSDNDNISMRPVDGRTSGISVRCLKN